MVVQQYQAPRTIYYQTNTKNQSFLDMHYYLRYKGIKNNAFMLMLFDKDLMYVNPRDPNINMITKTKILKECMNNFWYFLREIVQIPEQGGQVGGGTPYKLHRGNMAFNFLFLNNYNVFLELPRQHFKTTSSLCAYLWAFNFRTSNSDIVFIHQKHQRAKDNLNDLKDIRSALPSYLQMDSVTLADGTKKKVSNTVETLQHPTNFNKIRAMAGARSASLARNAARGMTVPMQYYDEFAFILYNKEMYMAAVPAFSKASDTARNNGAPYSILITTTPGVLTTDEGTFAYQVRNEATPWNEAYYDYDRNQLEELRMSNKKSNFFHVRYTYQQLGSGEEYFTRMCVEMLNDWPAIRREVLLEWSKAATNCPFSQEDLETIETLCVKEPVKTLLFGNAGQYQMHIWSPIDNMKYPLIVGADVAGGYQKDSTAITVIDSKTTKVVATFNCNYISMPDTAGLIEQLVSNYMPTAIVNIERDGGWGGSVLQMLVKNGKIKRNLYFEIKDKVLEERSSGSGVIRRQARVKQYGINTKDNRDKLMEILFQRVEYHKDKFIAPPIHSELLTLEVKKNERIEHSSNAHDDQIFSYLMALYVWYYGENLSQYNIYKYPLMTDQELEEGCVPLDKDYGVTLDLGLEENKIVDDQIKMLNKVKSISMNEYRMKEYEKDQKCLEDLIKNNKDAMKAYIDKYHIDPDYATVMHNTPTVDLPNSVFLDDVYNEKPYTIYQGSLGANYEKVKDIR